MVNVTLSRNNLQKAKHDPVAVMTRESRDYPYYFNPAIIAAVTILIPAMKVLDQIVSSSATCLVQLSCPSLGRQVGHDV